MTPKQQRTALEAQQYEAQRQYNEAIDKIRDLPAPLDRLREYRKLNAHFRATIRTIDRALKGTQ